MHLSISKAKFYSFCLERVLQKLFLAGFLLSQGDLLGTGLRHLEPLLIVLKVDGLALKNANYFEVFSPAIITLCSILFIVIVFQCVFCTIRGRSDGLFGGYGFFTEFFLQFVLTRYEIQSISEG